MPYYPDPDSGEESPYDIETFWHHLVAEYCNIPIFEVWKMRLDDFLYARREAFIFKMSQTEKGLEYLKNASMFEQTEPDRDGLKDLMKGMGA